MHETDELRPGSEPIPGYTLVQRLGEGGYAAVWKALAPGGFTVALKFVARDTGGVEVEQRSLDAIKSLRHPNLLSMFGAWQTSRYLVIAMELADRTWKDRFHEATSQGLPGIPRDELLEYMTQAAQGIDFLNAPHVEPDGHERAGVQHRDIKPENIMLVGRAAKVGDFGLARSVERSMTGHTGSLTPHFAAPEFFKGLTSKSSDQYSLAITYCLMRGGRLPFMGTLEEIMHGHLMLAPDLSMLPPLERPIVERAISKSPAERWPSCLALVNELKACPGEIDRAVVVTPPKTVESDRTAIVPRPKSVELGQTVIGARTKSRSVTRRFRGGGKYVFGTLCLGALIGFMFLPQREKATPASGTSTAKTRKLLMPPDEPTRTNSQETKVRPVAMPPLGDVKPLVFPGDQLFNDRPPFLAGVTIDSPNAKYTEGELISATFEAERTAHLYLVYHQADGTSVLLFPNVNDRETLVPDHTKKLIPTPGGKFRFRVQGPFGREVLQVVASIGPLAEFDSLLQPGSKVVPAVSRELLDGLAVRLLIDPSTWTEHRVVLETVPKPAPDHIPQAPRPSERIALCIGIGNYQNPELAETHVEMANSASVMHRQFLEKGGVQLERTRLVLNEQATRDQIEQSIRHWLPDVSQPGDTVFVYFSCHAARIQTQNPSEADGKNEALFPYDLTAGSPGVTEAERMVQMKNSSILDDTLDRWLQELSGRNIVLILDSYHQSGAESARLAAAHWSDRQVARLNEISQLSALILASCSADRQAPDEGTRRQVMWLTSCLSELFDKQQPVTVQDAGIYAQQRTRELPLVPADKPPEPQLFDGIKFPIALVP